MYDEIKNSCLLLKDFNNKEYYDFKISKKGENNHKDINLKKDYDYIFEIKGKEKLQKDFEIKLNSCMEKENILIQKQKEFKNLVDKINIDEKLLEKKLMSLIQKNNEFYEKINDQIIAKVLDYDEFIKDVTKIKDRLIRYRDSLFIGHCFKIYSNKIKDPLFYIITKKIIFLNNEKLFKMVNNIYLKLIKKIIDEIFEFIFQKISNNETFKSHKEDYEKELN